MRKPKKRKMKKAMTIAYKCKQLVESKGQQIINRSFIYHKLNH